MEQFLSRMERLLTGFEQLFEVLKALLQPEESAPRKASSYQFGYSTESWVTGAEEGRYCLQELIDSKQTHEVLRAQKGYPLDRVYHGALTEAIEVLQARLPVTVEQLLTRLEAGNLERGDIELGVRIREEARATGWKNAHKPVEAEEAELANYREVLTTLKQPQL